MWYILLNGCLALWVLFDSSKRKVSSPAGWTIGTFLCAPLAVPIYLATRPLNVDESRRGGTTWYIVKNFSFVWLAFMAVWLLWDVTPHASQDAIFDTVKNMTGIGMQTREGKKDCFSLLSVTIHV